MSAFLTRLGVVGPNTNFTARDYYLLGASQAGTIILLWPDNNRADAALCTALGLTVWIRLPGEGRPQVADCRAAIREFAGVATGVLLGNEPLVSDLWDHAWYCDACVTQCGPAARGAGLVFGAPGWRSPLPPPTAGAVLPGIPGQERDVTVSADLAARLIQVYGRCAVLGVHAYDSWQLATPAVRARLDAWHAWLPDLPVLISEAGIAGRWPLGSGDHDPGRNDAEKSARYAAFLHTLPDYVAAACIFMLGGDPSWEAFTVGGVYDPQGGNRYALLPAAWALLGRLATAGGA